MGVSAIALLIVTTACSRPASPPSPPAVARNVVLITIDTLRADRIGAYGYQAARTPTIDALAARGTRFERAYATAPITLTSHASMLSGRYPPGHGARHNGLQVNADTPLLAERFAAAGFATAAFVSAFPLDRRFGLARGFATYGDAMPRAEGRVLNERPGSATVADAVAWMAAHRAKRDASNQIGRFFLWVHLFDPHAPYGPPGDTRPAPARYDDEIAETDRQVGRLLDELKADLDTTAVVLTADHGEAFGEHGEIAHSVFVYDTTLQVPLIVAGPGVGRHVAATAVSLVDLAPTLARIAGFGTFDADGADLAPAFTGQALPSRSLYAESFAPLLDFGWSPLRSLRDDGWKVIDAPRPELYHVAADPGEAQDLSEPERTRLAGLRDRVQRYSPPTLDAARTDTESAARLQSLGYIGSATRDVAARPDPKDRRELAADIARVMGGDLTGAELERALRRILAADAGNPQIAMRLGYELQRSGRCAEALRYFATAIAGRIPSVDAHLGKAGCEVAGRRFDAAAATLREAERIEPGNAVVSANLGIVLSDGGRPADGIAPLQQALSLDPQFHEARFNLAIAYARLGRRAEAAREAADLLGRLPSGAPQRAEVERLLETVR